MNNIIHLFVNVLYYLYHQKLKGVFSPMNFYKDIFMRQFASALKEFLSIEKRDWEVLLGDYLIDDIKSRVESKNYRAFKETCKKLCRMGCYSTIIRFMYGVFLCGKKYNLAKLKNILDEITIRDDIKLSELCADFYLYSQKQSVFYQKYHIYDDYDFESIDLYRGDAEKYFPLDSHDEPDVITKDIAIFLLKRLFNMNVSIDEISRQDIDYIAAESIRIKKLEIEKEKKYIDEQNKALEEHEKEINMKLPRYAWDKVTEYIENLEVTGLLLDIFRVAASMKPIKSMNKEDIVYYIQTEYIWPIMKKVPWKQQKTLEVQLMGIMLEAYLSCIYNFEVFRNVDIYARIETDSNYNETDFFDEMVNNKPGLLSGPALEFGKKNPQLGKLMSEVIYPARDILKKVLPNYLYSFMMALVPYFLFFSGYQDEASDLLIKNYNQINSEDKQRFFLQITIAKCILSCKNLQRANILYGFFISELNRQDMEKDEILSVSNEIIEYIKDVKEYLYLSHEYTIRTQRAWHDVVFGDGNILRDVELAEKRLALNKHLPEPLFNKLMLYVQSFCNSSGIRLDLLGLPKEDDYDKLPDALSDELISKGQGIYSNYYEYMAFYRSLNQLKMRQSIDIFLQRHISKLMDEALEDTLEKLKVIREEIKKQNGVLNAENINNIGNIEGIESNESIESEKSLESILKKFDEVVDEFVRKLENQYIGREDIELYIDKLQMDFINKYNLNDVPGNNFISKLPYEERNNCNNFLVTSEIVYKMLSRRSDRNKLDFSPALISLTKALELVLNIVFQRLYITKSNIDKNSWDFYLTKQGYKKNSIEFGPCINLLKDSMFISVEKNEYGIYELSWETGFLQDRSRFSAIRGEQVIRFDRLSKFKGLELLIQPRPKQPPIKIALKEDDTEFNRMLFIKGLEYVKDNYRNNVAHKNRIFPKAVEDCRNILIQSEYLLWILLYVINC